MIIHDTDEEDDVPPTSGRGNVHFVPQPEPPSVPVPAPRARRPKDTQYKLGVGRPTAVGGRGPRNVTRSTSMAQKGKRAKGSKSVKPTEAAIQEEEGSFPPSTPIQWLFDDIPPQSPILYSQTVSPVVVSHASRALSSTKCPKRAPPALHMNHYLPNHPRSSLLSNITPS